MVPRRGLRVRLASERVFHQHNTKTRLALDLGHGRNVPFGAEKWMTFPSLLNMLTSSIAWMGWTLSFLSAVCSFLSSVPEFLWTFLTFLRGVPLPLYRQVSFESNMPLSFPCSIVLFLDPHCDDFVGNDRNDGGVIQAGGEVCLPCSHMR
jgi:hypothetical protein